jgi:cytochrome c-type biogenesis protein
MGVGGVVLVVMSLNMMGLFKIGFLNREKMVQLHRRRVGLLGSFLIGITFSLGWTPCIGPVLASILIIAATSRSVMGGLYLLSLYSLGLAVPFFIAALLVTRLIDFMQRYGYVVRYTSIALGGLLVVIGALLVSGQYIAVTRLIG